MFKKYIKMIFSFISIYCLSLQHVSANSILLPPKYVFDKISIIMSIVIVLITAACASYVITTIKNNKDNNEEKANKESDNNNI